MPVYAGVRTWPDHLYVRVAGEIRSQGGTQVLEQFTFGVRLGQLWTEGSINPDATEVSNRDLPDDDDLRTALTTTVEPAVRTLFALPQFAREVFVTQIGLNAMIDGGVNAKYRSDSPVYVYPGQPGDVAVIRGGSADALGMQYHYPPQIAVAITTLTSATRGLASKGRMFLPCPVTELGPDWRMPEVIADTLAAASATFLQSLCFVNTFVGDTMPTAFVPMVISPQGPITKPYTARPITGTRCGRVLDTMRSRRNALAEAYETATVAPFTP
jgi:hypothetical protein